jgi:hypothetical protein
MKKLTNWFEWAFLSTALWLYCLPCLDFGSSNVLPGRETNYFQSFGNLLRLALTKYGEFPLWNPYLGTGLPSVADPMFHLFNPFISLPILAFGVSAGFKLALFISFLAAGLGMWTLARELGLGRLGRLWLGLLYPLCGLPAAKFIQGHYLLVFGWGWIPFTLAALLATRRTPRAVPLTALGLTLVFLSGNGYYAYYLIYVFLIFALLTVFGLKTAPWRLTINRPNLKRLAAIGILTLGLSAVQLFPQLEYRSSYLKPTNPSLSDSQPFREILLDLTSPDPFRTSALSPILRPEEYYAYLGWWPLLGLLGLPLAWKRADKRLIVFFASLLVFTFLWINVDQMPWRELFIRLPLLAQFRYPSRMLVIGTLALVTLSGLGLESFHTTLQGWLTKHGQKPVWASLLFGGYLLAAALNLAVTSRPLLQTQLNPLPPASAAAWLRTTDPSLYYVELYHDWQGLTLPNELRYLNGGGPLLDTSRLREQISARAIEPGPQYSLYPITAAAPVGGQLIHSLDGLTVYRMEPALPFAFLLDEGILTTPSDLPLAPAEVTPVDGFQSTVNTLRGEVNSPRSQALILLVTYNANWQLTIDGSPAPLYNAYGYLAAEARPGTHQYQLVYRPIWFYVGLGVSLIFLWLILWVCFRDHQLG